VLRRGGAFFARRSFKGNALYSAVFSEYVASSSARLFRSSTSSKAGARAPAACCAQGRHAVDDPARLPARPQRPVLFQPVYIGYEKLMEGRSYLDELTGKSKQKESIWGSCLGHSESLAIQLRAASR
jgi:glycerol-3-phosphate O-acyltransferase